MQGLKYNGSLVLARLTMSAEQPQVAVVGDVDALLGLGPGRHDGGVGVDDGCLGTNEAGRLGRPGP